MDYPSGRVSVKMGKRLKFTFVKQEGDLTSFKNITNDWVFGEPGINHCSCLVSNRIYVYGGYGKGGVTFPGTSVLDLRRHKWMPLATNGEEPTARCGQSGTLVEDKLVVAGGWNNGNKFQLERYLIMLDLVTNEWTYPETSGTHPDRQYMHSMTWYPPKRILVQFGGKSAKGAHSKLYYLKLDTFEWVMPRTTGKTPPVRFMHGANILDSNLYVFGGKVTQSSRLNDMHILNLRPVNPVWSAVAAKGQIPPLIGGVTMNAFEGQFIVFGGKRLDTTESGDVFTFNPNTKRWKLVSTHVKFGNFRHTSHLQGSTIYIVGSPFVRFENYVKVSIQTLT